ncbi:MAG: hypothetical protein IT305_22380 [Chloroflexi bacterium]|nr:hypothetical protein [Chloroflexota bacterium]
MHDISGGMTARDIDRRLWLELTHEQYGLVRDLVRLEADAPILGLLDETDRLVDGLARHFPAFGPAIRAVARHLVYDGVDGSEACCTQPWASGEEV